MGHDLTGLLLISGADVLALNFDSLCTTAASHVQERKMQSSTEGTLYVSGCDVRSNRPVSVSEDAF